MSKIIQLYSDKDKKIKAYPKTLASQVYMDDGTTTINSQLDSIEQENKSIFINVKYPPLGLEGLKGDGLTDESSKLQAIITFASNKISSIGNEKTGLKLKFPHGHYLLKNINLPDNCGVSLVGEGGTKSTLELIDKTSSGVLLNFVNNNNYRGEITGLRLTGGIGGSKGKLISITGAGNQIHIHENWIDSCAYGIYLNPCADCNIYNNTMEFVNIPIKATASYDINIYGNMFYGYGAKETIRENFVFEKCSRVLFNENKIIFDVTLSGGAIIKFNNSDTFFFKDNIIYNNESIENCVLVTLSNRFEISGNILSQSISSEIKIENCGDFIVNNNNMVGSTTENSIRVNGSSNGIISSNNINSKTLYTRILAVNSTNIIINNNILKDDIYIEADCNSINIDTSNICSTINYQVGTPPVWGKWKKGDIVYNPNPVSGAYIGWICVDGDGLNVGTWRGFGLIQ